MIIGNTETFALEHRLMEIIAENRKLELYGSIAVWVAGKRFTTHDWDTWLTYVHTAVEYLSQDFFPDPQFSYERNLETKSAREFCRLMDYHVYGIGRNDIPTDEEIYIGSFLGKHELEGIFDAPFCDRFPFYVIDIKDKKRRIILRDRENGDLIYECCLPRDTMNKIVQDWRITFEKDASNFVENWGAINAHWSRVLGFYIPRFYRKQLSDELVEKKLWELQNKYAQKHGLKVPSQET